MDLVLIRNVLIYFDDPDKQRILENISRIMRPHAYLMLGSVEGVGGTDFQRFKSGRASYFRIGA